MKIAIKGHPTRGKEVIQILKSLGGKNTELKGTFPSFYYINNKNEITIEHETFLGGYKLYTLEEFEKEFPFKIGDEVITTHGSVGIIRALTPENDEIPYCIETEKGYIYRHQSDLKPYKEMGRNITLTLDKAKEWYKKGGELKEIALQAFSEKELNLLPRSWEEYCRKYGYVCLSTRYTNIPLKYDALIKLEQLRNYWWSGWKPEYNCGTKYTIKWDKDDLIVAASGRIRAFLIFPTREMAEEFLECFRDLIEKAGELI